ncbi:RNA-guided endonuclease InsQ/TnpB family protein [Kitasatospora sp. NPDC101155]|uniref:RNA-guided endonuclease InsQ/TnpB family protein n=1 Tax=Kitasatospora sp. NPDC101155 TaxID=3364097 RepID=UPI0037F60D29
MLSGRGYRLELDAEQAELCETFGDICRSVWNTALEQHREYRRSGAWMNYVPQAAELAEAKREIPWLRDAPSHVLQQTPRDLDRACREHGTFRVRWRSKVRWSPSFRFPAGNLITVERTGRNVRAKAGLNRAILDKGWHLLELALRNAARTTGTTVVLVDPAYTSQTCHACKHVDPKNRESQAVFECTACGYRDHADVNAAKNILVDERTRRALGGLVPLEEHQRVVGAVVRRGARLARTALVQLPAA